MKLNLSSLFGQPVPATPVKSVISRFVQIQLTRMKENELMTEAIVRMDTCSRHASQIQKAGEEALFEFAGSMTWSIEPIRMFSTMHLQCLYCEATGEYYWMWRVRK